MKCFHLLVKHFNNIFRQVRSHYLFKRKKIYIILVENILWRSVPTPHRNRNLEKGTELLFPLERTLLERLILLKPDRRLP